jgi:hypothetical protein
MNGRKRFIVTATLGLPLAVLVLPDGAKKLLLKLHHCQHPLLSATRRRTRHLFAGPSGLRPHHTAYRDRYRPQTE